MLIHDSQSSSQKAPVQTVTKFYFLREHRLHGIVTGMSGVRLIASFDDKLDRLLVSFRDAKVHGTHFD